jgi:hypothetical protein
MAHSDIQVTKTGPNKFEIDPKSQRTHTQHTVRWICNDGALKITFSGSESPLKSGAMVVDAPSGTTGKEKINNKTKNKRYRYVAEVTPVAGGPTFTADPDLIIEDGGGGPGKKKKTAKPKIPKKKTVKK